MVWFQVGQDAHSTGHRVSYRMSVIWLCPNATLGGPVAYQLQAGGLICLASHRQFALLWRSDYGWIVILETL